MTTNPFYTRINSFLEHSVAYGAHVLSELTSIQGGFDKMATLLGSNAESKLTIATGKLTLPVRTAAGAVYSVEGEGGVADTLDEIVVTNTDNGNLILLRGYDAVDITITHAKGGATNPIYLHGAHDAIMNQTDQWILLQRRGSYLYEICRSDNWVRTSVFAYLSGSMAFSLGAYAGQNITLDATSRDTESEFDTLSHKWTCKKPGVYSIHGYVGTTGITGSEELSCIISRGGTVHLPSNMYIGLITGTGQIYAKDSMTWNMFKGDSITMGIASGATAVTGSISGGSTNTHLTIDYVRPLPSGL